MESLELKNNYNKSKVLIIGATGFVGKELYENFNLDQIYETYGTYSKKEKEGFYFLDITNLENVKSIFEKIKPDIVIITAALTNVEYCETNKEEAYKINVIGVRNIAYLCKTYNCRSIYISTEYVFDGINGPYNEMDEVNPINYYGETKLQGEKIIQKEIENYLIVRTTVVYGWNLNSKNFIMQLIKNLNENKTMKVPNDQISSPTYCPSLVKMIKECCDKKITGIFNIVGNDIMDRYSFAIKAAEVLNLNKKLLMPIETKKLGQVACRPLNAGLKVDKICELLDNKPMSVSESLAEVMKLYTNYMSKYHKEDTYD